MQTATTHTDVLVSRHGFNLFLFEPLNQQARTWLEESTDDDAIWFAGALAVDARYAQGLATALAEDGFEVK